MTNFKEALERIYITKGAQVIDMDGIDHPKFKKVALVINKKIHWLDFNFSEIHELNFYLRKLNIFLTPEGKSARYLSHGDHNTFNDQEDVYIPVTVISKKDNEIFDSNSTYSKRSLSNDNSMMWHIQDIKQRYLQD